VQLVLELSQSAKEGKEKNQNKGRGKEALNSNNHGRLVHFSGKGKRSMGKKKRGEGYNQHNNFRPYSIAGREKGKEGEVGEGEEGERKWSSLSRSLYIKEWLSNDEKGGRKEKRPKRKEKGEEKGRK